jgi:hypothetical protein
MLTQHQYFIMLSYTTSTLSYYTTSQYIIIIYHSTIPYISTCILFRNHCLDLRLARNKSKKYNQLVMNE